MNYTDPEHDRAMERIMADAETTDVCRHCLQPMRWDTRGIGCWLVNESILCLANKSRCCHEPGGALPVPDEVTGEAGHIRLDPWRGEDVDPFDLAEGDGR